MVDPTHIRRARVNARFMPKPDFRGFRDGPSKGLGATEFPKITDLKSALQKNRLVGQKIGAASLHLPEFSPY